MLLVLILKAHTALQGMASAILLLLFSDRLVSLYKLSLTLVCICLECAVIVVGGWNLVWKPCLLWRLQ
jgi:hypothetical protein